MKGLRLRAVKSPYRGRPLYSMCSCQQTQTQTQTQLLSRTISKQFSKQFIKYLIDSYTCRIVTFTSLEISLVRVCLSFCSKMLAVQQ